MTQNLPKPKVSVLGTGRMGSAIASRLTQIGFHVTVWNRTKEKAEKLSEKLGITFKPTPVSAVQDSLIAILALADDNALLSVLSTFRRMDGLVVINTGTHLPFTASNAKEYVHSMGGCYIESPIVGGPGTVENGKAILLVAGDTHCLSSAKEVLESLGEMIYLGENVEKAQALKLSFNLMLINTVNALAESYSLAERYGVEKEIYRSLMEKTVFSSIVEKYLERMTKDPKDYASFRLRLAAKDLMYAVEAGFAKGISLPATGAVSQKYLAGIEYGLGDADYTRIYWLGKKIE